MTVAEYYHDKPFAMINWHRNWCQKQQVSPWCVMYDSINSSGEVKRSWHNCPYRDTCFTAFIHSDATADKGAANA